MPQGRKVLVVGSGGREHALALALLASPSVAEVLVCPGNAGTAEAPAGSTKRLRNVVGAPREVAKAESVALVVIGPEVPLCEGLVDQLTADGVLAYGPSALAARLEGSKSFMKDFVARQGLPTAHYVTITDASQLEAAVASFAVPPVVKADGLCAGKGVVVAETHKEALAAAREMLSGAAFGEAGTRVVLEERLVGAEASVHAICDGERVFMLPAAQDHKRIFDGDQGPNTGGMGTYAPAPIVTPALAEQVRVSIMQKVVDGMKAEGTPFRGTLFAGLMISPAGEPKVLEFNVRFGDPETQVLMSILDGDLAELLASAARGKLDDSAVRVTEQQALCVVLAAHGYPGKVRRGDAIGGLEEAAKLPNVALYHAGTSLEGERCVTSGGRVLGVTGRGASLKAAAETAYAAVDRLCFEGMQFRRDIGHRAL